MQHFAGYSKVRILTTVGGLQSDGLCPNPLARKITSHLFFPFDARLPPLVIEPTYDCPGFTIFVLPLPEQEPRIVKSIQLVALCREPADAGNI